MGLYDFCCCVGIMVFDGFDDLIMLVGSFVEICVYVGGGWMLVEDFVELSVVD